MTFKEIAELREKRARLVEQCRAIAGKAHTESRSLTGEEQASYDKMFDEQRKLGEQIKREEQLIEAERDATGQHGEEQRRQNTPPTAGEPAGRWGVRSGDAYSKAFAALMIIGRNGLSAEEHRALSAGAGTEGGFTLAPEQFVATLLKSVDDLVFIRNRATKFKVFGAASLGAASLDADPADADWTSEILSGNADSTMAFGKRELTPHALAKRLKVSNKLLRSSALPIADIVAQRLAYKFAIPQEKAFMTGDGANKPLGLFTASNNGISTSRDVATGNTSTSITFAGLNAAKYALKAAYRGRAEWLFHRDGVKQIAGLVDSDGQYLWQPAKSMGEPDMLLGLPVLESEYAPNTFTTGQYVGILGDFSYYWIADSMDLQIQVLKELYAEADQTGFIGRLETDGMPALGEAFSRVKLG